eukprot:gene8296-biopygen3356
MCTFASSARNVRSHPAPAGHVHIKLGKRVCTTGARSAHLHIKALGALSSSSTLSAVSEGRGYINCTWRVCTSTTHVGRAHIRCTVCVYIKHTRSSLYVKHISSGRSPKAQ